MSYKALYRSFRPSCFDEVIGQEIIIRTLRAQIERGRIAHAYLFTGPRGTGKTSVAKIFARAINCPTPINGDACGTCSVCSTMQSDNMDIIEMDAASNNGVDEVRAIRENVVFPPQSGKYKVYIIDEVHMLSGGAFNALLKTLEEPPAHAVFILATTEVHKLPATILSRCQRFNFKNISAAAIQEHLKDVLSRQDVRIDDDGADLLARSAEGGMRDALSLADMCISYCGNDIKYQDVVNILGTADRQFLLTVTDSLARRDRAALVEAVNRLVSDGRDIGVFMKDLISHLSDLLAISAAPQSIRFESLADQTRQALATQAETLSPELLLRAVEILTSSQAALNRSTRPRILLQTAFLRICTPSLEQDNLALLDRISALESELASLKASGIQVQSQPKQKKAKETPSAKTEGQTAQTAPTAQVAPDAPNPKAQPKAAGGPELWEALLARIRKSNPLLYSALREATGGELSSNTYTVLFGEGNQAKMAFASKKTELIATELSALVGSKPAVLFTSDAVAPAAQQDTEAFKQNAIDLFGEDNIKFI